LPAATNHARPDAVIRGALIWPAAYRAVFAFAVLAAGAIYLWCARASNGPFDWRGAQPGFYAMLAASFANGHLYLPIEPSPELLASPNPFDPEVRERYGVQDLSLYQRRYYLYHGVTPAWLLFTPYRLLVRRNLPEPFAAWLLCWLAYIFGCATLMRWLAAAYLRPPLALFALLLFAMAVCQSAPYLLQRVEMYEIAIAGGYFCLSAGFWCLTRFALGSSVGFTWLALASVFLGLAPGSRPDLVFAPLAAAAFLIWHLSRRGGFRAALASREWWAFALPMAACALLLGLYNYARFDNPFEFGTTWQIAPPSYFRPAVALENVVPGLFYLLASSPAVESVFPFYRLAQRMPFNDPNYHPLRHFFAEPTVGLFVIWPLAVLLVASPWLLRRRVASDLRGVLFAVTSSASASLLLTAALGLASHRFHLDWLPYFVLASLFVLAAWFGIEYRRPAARILARATLVLAIAAVFYSILANLALGLQGPYDTFVQRHPGRYVKYASWFSPIPRLRPLYNPNVTVEALFEIPAGPASAAVPLVSAGRLGSHYHLTAELSGNGVLKLTSAVAVIGAPLVTADVPLVSGGWNRIRWDYDPPSRMVTVRWNGQPALRHQVPVLVTAPVQLQIGEDRAELDPRPLLSPWRSQVLVKSINGVSY
jgi:hypothetical protein